MNKYLTEKWRNYITRPIYILQQQFTIILKVQKSLIIQVRSYTIIHTMELRGFMVCCLAVFGDWFNSQPMFVRILYIFYIIIKIKHKQIKS